MSKRSKKIMTCLKTNLNGSKYKRRVRPHVNAGNDYGNRARNGRRASRRGKLTSQESPLRERGWRAQQYRTALICVIIKSPADRPAVNMH